MSWVDRAQSYHNRFNYSAIFGTHKIDHLIMPPLLRTSRYLTPPFKRLIHTSLSNPLHKLFLSTASINTTHHKHGEEPSQLGPPPIRVAFTDSAGRGVFSTRRIGAGELIHTAKPVVSHPFLSQVDSVCYLCLRRLKPRNCTLYDHLLNEPFCSDDCKQLSKLFYEVEKRVDWSEYHSHCRTQGLKYPLLLKRLACMVAAGAASADCIDILQPAQILPEIEEEYSLLHNALQAANVADESLNFLTKQWYANVLARVRINAFRIEVIAGTYEDLFSTAAAAAALTAEAGSGNAVYIFPSFYNHDCDPNVHIIWMDNVDAKLKALRDIDEGEEMRICYIDASLDRDTRQNILSKGFGFNCSCERCLLGD